MGLLNGEQVHTSNAYAPRTLADAVGIVSVISTATVAIAVPYLTARVQRRDRVLARDQAAFDEIRQTLDTGGIALTEALLVLDGVAERVRRDLPPRSDAEAEVEDRKVTDEMWRCETRLGIRLGTNSACYLEYLSAAQIIHAALRPDSRGGSGVAATAESLAHDYDTAVDAQNRYFDQARAVLDVAGRSTSAPSRWNINSGAVS